MEWTEIFELIILFLSGLGLHSCLKIKKKDSFLLMIKFFWILMGLASLNSAVHIFYLSASPELYRALPLSLVYGPFLFFILQTAVKNQKISTRLLLWHLAPFILATLFYLYYVFNIDWRLQNSLQYHIVLYGLVITSCIAYSIYVFLKLSNLPEPNQSPVLFLAVSVVIFWIYSIYLFMTIFQFISDETKILDVNSYIYIVIIRLMGAMMVYILTLQVLIKASIKQQKEHERHGEGKYLIAFNLKNSQHQISSDLIHKLIDKFEDIMYNQQIYLDSELSLDKLALQLDIPPHQLTQLLNRAYGMSMFEMINRLRIKYACQLIKKEPNIAMIRLINDSGYSAESTFFRNFKSIMNVSPSQYRQAVIYYYQQKK